VLVLPIRVVADVTGLGWRDVFALDDLRGTRLVRRRDDPLRLRNNGRCGVRMSSAGFTVSHLAERRTCLVRCEGIPTTVLINWVCYTISRPVMTALRRISRNEEASRLLAMPAYRWLVAETLNKGLSSG
jgi:hypothetical protein